MPADNRVTLPYLQAWRAHKRLSLNELFTKSGVAKSTLIRLEHGGRANVVTIGRIAEALGIDRNQLVEETPEQRHGYVFTVKSPDGTTVQLEWKDTLPTPDNLALLSQMADLLAQRKKNEEEPAGN